MTVPASEIKRQLNERLEQVLDRYWPGWVKVKGHGYPAFVNKDDPGSFVVYLRDGRGKGEERGRWFRRSRGIGGDEINLVSYGASGEATHTDYPLAFREAASFLGVDGAREETPEEKAAREARETAAKQEREERERIEREDSIAGARAIWRQCQDGQGTLAEVYFAARGLDVSLIDWTNIRFHPSLYHDFDGTRWPAIVARVLDRQGRGIAVWRIYLERSGTQKLLASDAKLGKGPAGGGAVRLGGIGRSVALCEGLETGLAVRELLGGRIPAWPCLSTSGLIGVELPGEVEAPRIFPDGDKARTYLGAEHRRRPLPAGQLVPPPGREAARKARERFISEGRRPVLEAEPPPTKDYLDVLLATKRAA